MNKKDCLQIGTIVKTHGVSGEVILEIKEPVLIELVRESVLLEIDGLLVPFFIAENRQTSNERLRIRFERVTTENHSRDSLLSIHSYRIFGNRQSSWRTGYYQRDS